MRPRRCSTGTTSSRAARLTRRSETLLPAQEYEHLIDHVRAQMRRHVVDVLRRADGRDIDGDDIQVGERADQVDALARGEPTPRRRAYARRAGRIEHVHVETD